VDAQPVEDDPAIRGRMRRLVLAPSWLGDCVMAIPALRALRRADPSGVLVVLAPPGAAPLLRMEGSATDVRVRRGRTAAASVSDGLSLRRWKLDEAWVLPNSFRSAAVAWLSGARRRFGYAGDGRRALLTEAPGRPPATSHQLRDYDRLLEAGGVAPDTDPPRIAPPEEARAAARRLLEAHRVAPESRPIFLAPGAAFGPTKRWSAERFAFLADALMDEGRSCVIAVGPSDLELGRLVARRARHRIPVLGSDLDAGQLAALFRLGGLLVGNDSGPAHVAAAVGTPTLIFFGPTDPGRTRPEGAPSVVLDRYVFCSPCFRKRCPYGHECMEEIDVDKAARAAREILARPPSRGRPQGQ
jgi:heptosyltransferase-2